MVSSSIEAGRRVVHPRFGQGCVKSIDNRLDAAIVDFLSTGEKIVLKESLREDPKEYTFLTRTAPIQEGDYEDPPFVATRLGPEDLGVDRSYRRGFKERVVQKIVQEGWDQDQADYLRVAQREDGSYWIIDGVSRWEAARRLDLVELPVLVFCPRSIQEESFWFKRWNLVQPYERFKIALDAGEEPQVSIHKIVRASGLRLMNSRLCEYSVNAVSTLEKIYGGYGPQVLQDVLWVIVRSWEGEQESTTEDILKALTSLLWLYQGRIRLDDLVFRLQDHKASWWRREAEGARGFQRQYVQLALLFHKAYNYYRHHSSLSRLPLLDPVQVEKLF